MTSPTQLEKCVSAADFFRKAMKAVTATDVDALLQELPITGDDDYTYNKHSPEKGWREGRFHWIPVGGERGNAGRINQANLPVNPIAERAINGMEALIELARQRELAVDPAAPQPTSPREAVARYFQVPPLDQLPKLDASEASKATRVRARDLARQLRVRLHFDKPSREFTLSVEDDGIGQPPSQLHSSLLSLGTTSKADKWYLIGIFGQGGSSTYAVAKKYSWIMSRRAPDLLNGEQDGVGWTVIKRIFPKGMRDHYYAYLACHPDGRVPYISKSVADELGIKYGSRFVHTAYDFGKGGSAITRQLYAAMNHVLFNPVLPFELYVGPTAAIVYGNGYRMSSLGTSKSTEAPALDKTFPPQPVGT